MSLNGRVTKLETLHGDGGTVTRVERAQAWVNALIRREPIPDLGPGPIPHTDDVIRAILQVRKGDA